ncbi:hypothetical protein OPAG_01830 [Rhodococcus opacus PD630]|nr:hypothetical protein OPAG_01830 [Rhodococcus opacus PD630]
MAGGAGIADQATAVGAACAKRRPLALPGRGPTAPWAHWVFLSKPPPRYTPRVARPARPPIVMS